ncbi:MAG: YncE family protein [Actinobacteria bacterium]|nr:YncE family protein [Actinomycetota bacterium]
MTAEVPEGTVDVTLTHPDRGVLYRRVTVRRNRRFRWWLDPDGQLHHKVAQFKTGSAPKQVAFTPDRRELWVTLLGGPGVEVFRPRSGKRLATIDLGKHGAVEVIFTADGSTAYVSQMESGSVFEIDTATHEIRRQLSTGGSWTKVMALGPDETRLYASNWSSNDVSEIDLTSGEVLRRLPTVGTPRGLYVAPDGDTLYVAGFDAGQLERIDLRDGSSEVLTSTGGAMRHLVGDGDVLYADDMGRDAIFTHDLDRARERRFVRTDEKPNTIDLGADGRVLYVSNRGENNPQSYYLPGPERGSVLAFDAATGEPLDAIVGGNQTTGLDVSDDGQLLAFSDFLDNRVQVYEIPPYDDLAAGDGGRFGPHRDDLVK